MKLKRYLAVILALLMFAGMMPATAPTVAYAATSGPYSPSPDNPDTGDTGGNTGGSTPQKKHTHHYKKSTRVEPTCTKSGYQQYKCSCGKKKKETLPKLGHRYGSWKVTKEANCAHTGTKTRTCSRCGKTQTETLSKTDHSYGSWRVTKEATCVKTGTRERKCKVCGKTQTDTLKKTDHKYEAWTVTQEPSCVQTGARERKCRVCGKVQTDTLRKTDHAFGEWIVTTPATDHSAGTRTRTCQVCGEEETEDFDPEGTLRRGDTGDDVKALQEGLICYGTLTGYADGDFGSGTERAVRAMQEAEGFEADGVAWPQTQGVLGHVFGEWETISELSDFSKLERHRVCQRCGYTETEEEWPAPMYRHGDSGDGVEALQKALNDAGYDCGWPDGDFGSNTERAVSAIETDHGVEGDGIAWPGVLKWLNLVSDGGETGEERDGTPDGEPGGDDQDDNDDDDGQEDVGGITTYSAPRNAPEDIDYPVMPDMADPFVTLTHDEVGVVEIKLNDTLDVKMHLINAGDIPVTLKSIDVGSDESYSTEAWMSGELEPGKTYDFTYHIRIGSNDTKPSASHRDPMVTVADPVTGKEASSSDWITFSNKKTGARIAIHPDRSYPLRGTMDDDIAVSVTVMNNGEVPLENLSFSWLNSKTGDRPSDSVDGFSDASLVSHMEPGDVLTLFYSIHVVDGDVGSSAYSASRKFTVTAEPAEGSATPVSDSFSIGFTVVESGKDKVSIVKKEISERPREAGYYPGEKITYEVTVQNDSERALELVNLYDPLSDEDYNNFGTITNLKPGKSATRQFEYTVDDSAAGTGYVETAAKAIIEDGVEFWTTESNTVKTPCAKNGEEAASGEKSDKDLELKVIPKDPKITSVTKGDDLEYILRIYNKSEQSLTGAFIRAYDGEGGEREMYYSDLDPLPAGKYYEVEDHYVVTEEDVKDTELKLNWEAFGKPKGGDWLTDDIWLSYGISAAEPDGGGEYDWKPPTEPEPEVSPVVLEPEPVTVDDVILKLEIMTEMKYAQGFVSGDSIVFNVIAENNGDALIDDVDIWDTLHGLEPGKEIKKDSMAYPGKMTTGHTYYTVTEDDVEMGFLEITGHVKWKDANGEYHEGDTNTAHLPLFGVNLTIEQTVVGGEDQVLHKGDTVTFLLKAKNPSDIDVSAVKVYHRLNASSVSGMGDLVAENVAIPAHGSRTYKIEHEVDDDDVVRGKVTHSGSLWDGLGYGSSHYAYTKGAELTVSPEGYEDMLKPLDIMMTIVGGEDQVFKQDDKIEIKYTVHNPRSVEVKQATISGKYEGKEGYIKVAETPIPAHGSVTRTYNYTVTGPDAIRGYVRTKGVVSDGLGTTGIHESTTEWVKLTVEGNDDADKPLVVTKAIQGGDDQVFFLGDEIIFEITVENPKDFALTNVEIRDQPAGKSTTYLVADKVKIPAHKSVTKEYKYTVTDEDVVRTTVPNWAFAYDGISSGDGHSFKSNTVTANIGPSGDLQKPVTVTKTVKGGKTTGYKENDTIIFVITVNNPKSIDLPHVEIYDYPNGTSKGILVTNSLSVPAHGSNSIEYPYTVTHDDVERGYVTNKARAWDGISNSKDGYVFSKEIKVDLDDSPAETKPLTVTKAVVGGTVYHVDDEITYTYTITNPTEDPQTIVTVYDHMNGALEGTAVDTNITVPAHDSVTKTFTYVVKPEDLERGWIDDYILLSMGGEHGSDPKSNTVHVTVEGISPGEAQKVTITKSIIGGGTEFHVNDTINYHLLVTNSGDAPITNVKVYDHMNGDPTGKLLESGFTVPAHNAYGLSFPYIVTDADLERGYIDNFGRVTWEEQEIEDPESEKVHVTIVSDGELKPLTITKQVKDGADEFYKYEGIVYEITIKNPNSVSAKNVTIYDHMNFDPVGDVLYSGITVPANDEVFKTFTHIVNAEDVSRTYIDNHVRAHWDDQPGDDVESGNVHVTILKDPEGAHALKVTKAVVGGTEYHVNDVITYAYTITNPTEDPQTAVTVYDHMNGALEGTAVDTNITVPAHGSVTRTFTYTVKPEDLTRGWIEDYIRLYVGTEEGKEPTSNTVHVDIVDGKPTPSGGVTLAKWVTGKTYYLEDEIVPFELRVENHTGGTITNVVITDALSDAPGKIIATFASIPDGLGKNAPFPYCISPFDAGLGSITNTGKVSYVDAAGKTHTVPSNPVTVYTGKKDTDVPNKRVITATVEKKVDGGPKNHKFYVEGEQIHYLIHVTYDGYKKANEIIITDPLKAGGVVGKINNVAPGYSGDFDFYYTVTKPDVDHTKVVNVATITVWLSGKSDPIIVNSLPVTSPTGKEITFEHDDGEPDPGDKPNDPGETPEVKLTEDPTLEPRTQELNMSLADSCVRTLIGRGEGVDEYAQTYCPEHARIADAVRGLLEEAGQADTDEAWLEAWQQAVTLWTDAVNAEYEAQLAKALEVEVPIIEAAQTAFFAQLAAREEALNLAYPDQPETVARMVSELLMNQCVELCYEAHTAPQARADSLNNGLWRPIEETHEAEEQCEREVTPLDVGATYLENLCERHRITEAAVDALLEEAQLDETDAEAALAEAWLNAKQLWLTELDALANERYLAAGKADRDAIAAERISFGSWLSALESALTLAYPDHPMIVNEVMAETIRSRVLDLCGEEME